MLCHQCGSSVSSEATECPNCGATLKKRATRSLELPSGGLQRYTQKLKAISPADKRLFVDGELVGGRYKLGEMLGRGAFGQVFMAMDTEIDVQVALKVFAPDFYEKDKSLKRFEPALKKTRKLDHVNLVRINEHGQHQQHLWVAMQHLEGLSLRKLIKLRASKDEHFEANEIDRISTQLFDALEHINRQHPHVNLKPENVIFLPDMLKVTDHYLYRALHPDALLANHIPNAYLAPEIKKLSNTSPTQKADVFSMGAILAELAFGVNTLDALGELPPQTGFRQALLAECTRALSPNPSSRHNTLQAFASTIKSVLDESPSPGLVAASAPSITPPPAPPGDASESEEILEESEAAAVASVPLDPPTNDASVDVGEALGLDDGSSVAEEDVEASEHELGDELSEDEIATIEAERVLAKPELGDLLPTNEVDRGQIPLKSAPSLTESASTSSLIDARKVQAGKTPPPAQEKGFPIGIILFVAVAVIIIAVLINANQKKEVVRIGEQHPAEVVKDDTSKEPVVATQDPVVSTPDAAPDLSSTPSTQVLSAFAQARDMGGKALNEATSVASQAGPPDMGAVANHGASNPDMGTSGTGTAVALNSSSASGKKDPPKDDEKVEPKDDDAPKTNCPKGMVLLKSKKYPYSCVDRYEYPGKGKPKTRVTWFQAKKLCEGKGKRLCARSEWSRACGGKYPWKGKAWDANKCNTTDEDDFERSLASVGSFKKCRSRSGAYDMVGNAFEWTMEKRIVGGSHNSGEGLASCSYSSAKSPSSSAADIGFRCCADPN